MSAEHVSSIPDDELLRRAVSRRGNRRQPRWATVADRFCLGSTFATQLCRRFDLDPEERA